MDLGVSADCRSMALGRLNIERAQPRCIDPPFIHRHSTDQASPKRRLERIDFLGGHAKRRRAALLRVVKIVYFQVGLRGLRQIELARVPMTNLLRHSPGEAKDILPSLRDA